MKYAKNSTIIPGAKDYYEIISYNVNKQPDLQVMLKLLKVEIKTNGISDLSYKNLNIVNKIETIIDPAWNETSTPPKPEGFDPLNPITWGDLSWDEIPRIINPDKLYVNKILEDFKTMTIDESIFNTLKLLGEVPSGSEWSLLDI